MQDALESEELALRRRLLFRLLRGSGPGRTAARAETISELVPKGLIAPGESLFQRPQAAEQKPA